MNFGCLRAILFKATQIWINDTNNIGRMKGKQPFIQGNCTCTHNVVLKLMV